MSIQAKKINNLIEYLGLNRRRLAPKIGVHFTTISRKAKDGSRYDDETLEKISREIGISVDFLLDDSREYIEGQPIPPDAIIQPPAAQERQGDSDAITKLFILAEREMEYRTASNAKIDPNAMLAAQEELAQEMRVLSNELRLLREEMARSREEDGGNHDADF